MALDVKAGCGGLYQKPEQYVREFIDNVLARIGGSKREEATLEGYRFAVDYAYAGKVVIEAKAPGRREHGRAQLLGYMERLGYKFGVLVDIPSRRYYSEYPKPYRGKVGFEIYIGETMVYVREFGPEEVEGADDVLAALLQALAEVKVGSLSPTPENVLGKVKGIVARWEGRLARAASSAPIARNVYMKIWRRNMELLYGRDVVEGLDERGLAGLFARLTIYVAFLKALGYTLTESMLGGGRYTIPLRLLERGGAEAVRLFWERRALTGFNINYLFERDEYDWIFHPSLASDPEISGFFKDLGRALAEIDWSGPIELDLLKRVYQNIVGPELRRQLGEYYTPDWLAKLLLWRALHTLVRGEPPSEPLARDLDKEIVGLINEYYRAKGRIPSFIDPTCGSFTFGVQYLNALLRWYEGGSVDMHPLKLARLITENVVGLDLNPVAIVTAKVNYLIQIHRLLTIGREYVKEEPMIPIYRVDLLAVHEISAERRADARSLLYYLGASKKSYELKISLTDLGIGDGEAKRLAKQGVPVSYSKQAKTYYLTLRIPRSVVHRASGSVQRLHRALTALFGFGVEAFEREAGVKLSGDERSSLETLMRVIKKLEEEGADNVWRGLIINHLMALVAAERGFDLVVGNLPWVNVSKYPERYRERLRRAAAELGVSPPREAAKKLDVSVVLFAVSTRYFLKSGGVVCLMVPASLFRGLHGSGWRSLFVDGSLALHEALDFEDLQPFEKAQNQPGAVIAVARRAGG